ncbi:restriction endonuclease subunit M [Candidatus Symbiobacter mobilis]|uniref:site-specific DNA-methyltransferase (cytosine-N(4)-specific) n=1 Tax=Candidatus Symbiobacter mobilis CR TaxID=946483 RepID=U5NA84_9BURK|nr:restriction endonuclease subunit M [Candidatus Symbiobacter mobilis]AGX88312.1 DNA modification methylase [Candidatus Symbiobacter mobilis CR]
MSAVLELERTPLRQRSDYTYKFNAQTGRHGWLRLTPAYSLKVVEELITGHGKAKRIFDPFCGTGTTVLSSAYHGHVGVTTDINPFLVWFARAKTAHYSPKQICATRDAFASALALVRCQNIEPAPAPPIHNIERWWSPRALDFLRLLRAAIPAVTKENSAERTLLLIAFCRSLIQLSNAAFNHQSMSFKDDCQFDIGFDVDMEYVYSEDVRFVLSGASENPVGEGYVVFGDARNPAAVVEGLFDLVVTSPPYANRMSYIRELRPYMYWIGFLINGRDAGELDWTAIGGTWGIATSRLTDWKRSTDCFRSTYLSQVLDQISHSDNKNGAVLANYVAKYFDDIWTHFRRLIPVLCRGAELHYIVGNSTFYGTLVSTELLYAEMLTALGFSGVECRPIRKRNSKKELVEFDVVARWQ